MAESEKFQDRFQNQQSDSMVDSKTRRKLIKGSAVAVPVVMTLRSGAAFALNSSEMCVAKDELKGGPKDAEGNLEIISDLDNLWVQVQTECRVLTQNSGPEPRPTFEVYKELKIDPVASEFLWRHRDYDGSSNTRKFEDTTPTDTMKEVGTSTKFSYPSTSTSTCFVLVQVDDTGYPIGYGLAASGTPYATESCLCSAAGDINITDIL